MLLSKRSRDEAESSSPKRKLSVNGEKTLDASTDFTSGGAFIAAPTSWYRADVEDELIVLEFAPHTAPVFRTYSRKELCELAQEKARDLFNSLLGAIRFRDLRVLSPDSTSSDPTIIVRTMSCLLSLDIVRAILLYDRMLLLIPNGADELIRLIKFKMDELSKGIWDSEVVFTPSMDEHGEDHDGHKQEEEGIDEVLDDRPLNASSRFRDLKMRPRGSNSSLPVETLVHDVPEEEKPPQAPQEVVDVEDFSLVALEAILWTAVALLDREQSSLRPKTAQVIQRAKKDHSERTLEQLRQARKAVNRLLTSAERQVLAMINLTKNDRDMSLLSFKNIVRSPEKYKEDVPEAEWVNDHQDVEMLLESYIQRFDSIINDVRWLIEQTEQAEASIAIDLDVARNRLLRMNITITGITAFSGIGAFIAGVFGMNLNSGLQQTSDPPVFWIIAGVTFFFFLFGVIAVLILSRRL